LTILASVIPDVGYMFRALKFKVDHVTSPRPFHGQFVVRGPGLATINRNTKFEVSIRLPATKIWKATQKYVLKNYHFKPL